MTHGQDAFTGFGDVVDRIVCTPVGTAPYIRKGAGGPVKSHYAWMKVYDAARKRFERPLTLLAAERLHKSVGRGDHVVILTNSHETDGPPGAAAVARAVILGLDAVPVILTSFRAGTRYARALPQTCIGAGLIPVTDEQASASPRSVRIRNWPATSVDGALQEARTLFEAINPAAVLTVEATGCNAIGVRHGALGVPRNPSGDPGETIVRWNPLLDLANETGILTIATGDNGNECGFGTISDILQAHHVFCADCGCPCGGGIVAASTADVVVPGSSSNWASYGIEACLAALLDNPEVMHDAVTEARILMNCANVGIPDGASSLCTPTIDGASQQACVNTVSQLRETVLTRTVEYVRAAAMNRYFARLYRSSDA
jgi:hypothetical protein